jgi:hypothetical protein
MRVALDMYEVGEQMVRQRLRRERPAATPTEIDAEVTAWRLRRPGAEHGDSAGAPSQRFR